MTNQEMNPRPSENEDPFSLYFDNLCTMADQLKEDLAELNTRRDICQRCENTKNKKNIKIWIFQHPYEEKRVLRTTRILEKCLDEKNFEILKSKRFSVQKFPELDEVYKNENTYVLYPSDSSLPLKDFRDLIDKSSTNHRQDNSINTTDQSEQFHVILIDGTWAQASGIYYTNDEIQKLKQIKIDEDYKSVYSIRTQPREFFLSTLETVSIILATIEKNPTIYDDLVRPLKALCDFQFDYGAQPHQSKEYLIYKGLYKKQLSKKSMNKLTKNSKFDFSNIHKITENNNNQTVNNNNNEINSTESKNNNLEINS